MNTWCPGTGCGVLLEQLAAQGYGAYTRLFETAAQGGRAHP